MPAKLKVKDPRPKLEASARQQDQPRRSQRVKDLPKNDYLMMGMGNLQQGYGLDFSDDDYRPKRIRRNFREDDSYDYQGNGKRPRKKIHMLNRVQTLLEWKNNVRQPQILADGDAKCYSVKKLSTENLEKYGKNIEALFINIAWGEKGQNMEDFIKLKIENNSFMRKGIVFVWTPKQHFASIMDIMEKKGFTYVENFQIIYMSKQKALQNIAQSKKTIPDDSSNSVELKKRMTRSDKVQQQQETNQKVLISQLIDTNPVQLIQQQPSSFFNMSKKTLLMFRKVSEQRIQLRHQRTCDVIFDMPSKKFGQCTGDLKDYVYKMIETLLPKCFAKFQPGYQPKRDQTLKMVELWGEPNHLRKGWINISEK